MNTHAHAMPSDFSTDLQTQLHSLAVQHVVQQLKAHALWRVVDNGNAMLYHVATGLLWHANPDRDAKMDLFRGNEAAAASTLGGLSGWRVPTRQELADFALLNPTPVRTQNERMGHHVRSGVWLTTSGTWDFEAIRLNEGPQHWGALLAVNDSIGQPSAEAFVRLCRERGWSLAPSHAEPDVDMLAMIDTPSLSALFADIDYASARLPRLADPFFNDPAQGLWELWDCDPASLAAHKVRARNPTDDIVDWDVAIDFGTSSSVVAYNEHGRRKLLRVGMDRFWEAEHPDNYENPTALEFIDLRRMLEEWRVTAYRPAVRWDDVHCAHTAVKGLDALPTIYKLVPKVMTGLKQWALRGDRDARLFVCDDQGDEYELEPLAARNPVRGTPLQVGLDDPFDPIELYAWFLGMNINWRGRGIFLRYYMSFPVAYPQEARDKILASFRRGLQRSLPATLIHQPAFAQFRVEELATEPAAYAAAALPALGITPTAEGIAYAVFDFGGGTTDFEFGNYRLPTDDEDEELEEILEHCGASGDVFLGGELLLANMAYLVFQHNLDLCREHGITFTRPSDASDFAGHEKYVDASRIAATNTAVLMAALRQRWESAGEDVAASNGTGSAGNLSAAAGLMATLRTITEKSTEQPRLTESIGFLDRVGKAVDCRLQIPDETIDTYLTARIGEGVHSFFVAMRQAFAESAPQTVHVLLAGNASRSRIVENYFFSEHGSELFGDAADWLMDAYDTETAPEIIVHRAPAGDRDNPVTGKTGVALGLLRLCPGTAVATKDSASTSRGREAPFGYFVGRIRRGRFSPALAQGQAYGQWVDLGSSRDQVLRLAYTRSPLALAGELVEGHAELAQRRIEFGADPNGKRIFVRATGPHDIEIALADSHLATEPRDFEQSQYIHLN